MKYTQWPFKEALRIQKRAERLNKTSVIAQTGYGPSGLPHIGTFGEVARTSFVLKALGIIAPQIKSRLICFSDDMDGLREVPLNVPNRDTLRPYLGKPLTSIPDPFGEEESYAHHMNRELKRFLDSFGFEYEFVSSTSQYKSSAFNEGIKQVMARHEKIVELFTSSISEEKRAGWSPFFPVCEQCAGIYTTRVTGHNIDENSVSYICDQTADGKFEPCGHTGQASALDGNCKLGWKVDWALRWGALGVDYEMHGEDLMESARLSSRIAGLTGVTPPDLFKYELFLDETGAKISKKIGNGVSIDQWLEYGPVDSLLYFMYLKPQKAKRMGLPILPKIIDGYLELVAKDSGASVDSPLTFISSLSKGARATAISGENIVTWSLIYNLAIALNVSDQAIIREYLLKYQPEIAGNMEYYDELISHVIAYYKQVYLPGKVEQSAGHDHDDALKDFADELEKLKADPAGLSAQTTQTLAFQVAKEREIPMKEWFTTLYRVFLKQSSGPKIGSFVALIGAGRAVELIKNHLRRQG